jgi:hypothetical protein
MARVYLRLEGKKWVETQQSDFWLDRALYDKLKSLKKIQSKEWDGVIIIDGQERSGKSILGMACGWYLSGGKMTEKNFATGIKDCAKKISELPDGSVLQIDEGSLMFSGKDSLNKQVKQLMKILDVVGQKNIIFIVCLPCFFDLNKTIAVRRSKFLCHVYPDKEYNRGNYAFWGENAKKKLYRIGKKNYDSYAYPVATFIGKFPHFKPPFYDKYIKKIKKESLREVLEAGGHTNIEDTLTKDQKKWFYHKLWKNEPKIFTKSRLSRVEGVDPTTIGYWIDEIEKKEAKNTEITRDLTENSHVN